MIYRQFLRPLARVGFGFTSDELIGMETKHHIRRPIRPTVNPGRTIQSQNVDRFVGDLRLVNQVRTAEDPSRSVESAASGCVRFTAIADRRYVS